MIEKDGDRLLINGKKPTRNPIIQAKAQSRHLSNILSESTGQSFAIQPVVIYPGWFVKNSSADSSIHVLNEKMLSSVLANSPVSLAGDKIHLAAYHLSRHITAISAAA